MLVDKQELIYINSVRTQDVVLKQWMIGMDGERVWLVGWLFGLYSISTIVGYLIPNPLYTYILNIYDLVWLDFMAYQPL